MIRQWRFCTSVLMVLAVSMTSYRAAAQYAAGVVSHDAGTTPATDFGGSPLDFQPAALGAPERFTGEGVWPGAVSPFNPPFLSDEIISVGEGGHLTLRLSHFALPQTDGPEIGVFTNTGLVDIDYPNGQAGSPVDTFGVDSALVEVSSDGTSWVSLGNVTFDIPTNGYTDLTSASSAEPGNVMSDFQQPFTGTLSSFDGLAYYDADGPDILDLLAGSGGGTWLDISGTGLAQVGFVRLSVADDLSPTTWLNFELDAVSIAHAAQGPATVPEPAGVSLLGWALLPVALLRRRPEQLPLATG
jgi:hypothetical protein